MQVADGNIDSSTVLRVKTIHISSAILAQKSPFFYQVKTINLSYDATKFHLISNFCVQTSDLQLFSNETREPGQRITTMRIHDYGKYESDQLYTCISFFWLILCYFAPCNWKLAIISAAWLYTPATFYKYKWFNFLKQ